MTNLTETPAAASLLALASTLHAALAVLRVKRGQRRPGGLFAAVPSFLFIALPWLLPPAVLVAAGFAVHLAWFIICERILPAPSAARFPARVPKTTPAAAPVAVPALSAPRKTDFTQVPVLAVLDETPDIRTFRVARPEGFDFRAGQFLTVRVLVDAKPLVRCYSISSAPEATGYLEITVKRQGVVSGMLHAAVRPGSVLSIRPPAGGFVYPEGDERPLVLLAGGVGVTPLMSMLRHAVNADPSRPVALVVSAKNEADVPYRGELSLIPRRFPQARVVVALTQGTPEPSFWPGRVDARLLRQLVAEPAGAIFCLCGPLPMIASMKQILAELGVPSPQVRSEAFEAAVASASAPASAPGISPTPRRPAIVQQAAAVTKATTYTVVLTRSDRRVEASPDQSLLEAIEAAGVEVPSSCRAGICGTCRTRVESGEVDGDGDALDSAEREEGYVLPCVARARSRVVMEA